MKNFPRGGVPEELPPRARRILPACFAVQPQIGTTSACAENTGSRPNANANLRNYLRVRGEYPLYAQLSTPSWELPPRARRIRFHAPAYQYRVGTTSACAENTIRLKIKPNQERNYLRVRGEYFPPGKPHHLRKELPPRARRIQQALLSPRLENGTTSACAENTLNELGLL